MPRAGPSRSQRSQREPQPSQRVRGRRADTGDDDDSEHGVQEMDPDNDMDVDATQAGGADANDVSLTCPYCIPSLIHSFPTSTLTKRRVI